MLVKIVDDQGVVRWINPRYIVKLSVNELSDQEDGTDVIMQGSVGSAWFHVEESMDTLATRINMADGG